MFRLPFPRRFLITAGIGVLLLCGATAEAQQYGAPPVAMNNDAAPVPGRVARLAYLSGQTQFAPAGENGWGTAELNRPMVVGDRLVSGSDGLAVVELGDASVRIDHESAFDFLNLTEGNVQIELSQGTLNAAVRQLAQGENFEIDTPTIAFVATTPGVYRVDDNPDGPGSMVTVFQGSGTVYGENGSSRQVVAGTSYRFNDSSLAGIETAGVPPPDAFDQFCEARDQQYQQYAQRSQPYVPPEMIGGDQLAQYGQWGDVPQYGNVWYPNSVPTGWAPYRYGRWVWIDPWGWTWVDNQPWGFAPFHYGRWVYVANRWGWVPGPVTMQPVYAPAMVAFLGSGLSLSMNVGGGPVGWFPLGPRDVYVPWFAASRTYFDRVNVTNIRVVNRTVINNYYTGWRGGRMPHDWNHNYAYRNMAGAVTAVPRNVFVDARPVHSAALRLNRTQLAHTNVAWRPGVNPEAASLGSGAHLAHTTLLRGKQPFTRPVVARRAPAPQPVAFAAREPVIAKQHGQPLTGTQLRDLDRSRPVASSDRGARVKLVPTRVGTAADVRSQNAAQRPTTRPAGNAANATLRPVVDAGGRPIGVATPGIGTVHPIQAPVNPARGGAPRGEALPSARFAHPQAPGTLPRTPEMRAATEAGHGNPAARRLPVVQPVEPAPRASGNGPTVTTRPQTPSHASERPRQAPLPTAPSHGATQVQAEQRAQQVQAEQRAQQQRAQQVQAEQRAQQQRAAAMQQQAQARQFQQQRAPQAQRPPQFQPRPVQQAPQPNHPAPEPHEAPRHHSPPPSSERQN